MLRSPRLLVLGLAGCTTPAPKSDPAASPDPTTGTYEVVDPGETDTEEPPPPPPPWGLDARPANTTCVAPAKPALTTSANVTLEPAFPNLSFSRPTSIVMGPSGDRWYVLESEGILETFPDDATATATTVAMDIQDRVTGQLEGGGEMGLLGIAFHPEFDRNGFVYLSYTTTLADSSFQSNISRFTSTDSGATFDPASEKVLFTLAQPTKNHNGGRIAFGPDDMLWIGFGDGGGYDHQADAPNPMWHYGKILRIDVDGGDPYGIPTDNPYADGMGGLPEVWAGGFRNPWGWSVDPVTGELWVADVGPSSWEEVNLVETAGNHGWPQYTGSECRAATEAECDVPDRVDPIYSYAFGEGKAVIGGLVYRGNDIPGLYGDYLFADYISGWLRVLRRDPRTGEVTVTPLIEGLTERISTFTTNAAGEVYVVTFSYTGTLQKLVPVPEPDTGAPTPVDPFPTRLSQTGCVDPANPTIPAAGLIPYTVRWPFWVDGLAKSTWVALPDGLAPTVSADGDIALPVGSVVMKEIRDGDTRVETRLMVHHEDGDWGAYAYRWTGDDAELVEGAVRVETSTGSHTVPHRWECTECHTDAAGATLGLELRQLATDLTYPSTGRTADQIETWQHIGLLGETLPELEPLPLAATAEALDARVRAWLHVNCSSCHRPDVERSGHIDLRYETPLASTGMVMTAPQGEDLGLDDPRILVPGNPDRSLLVVRSERTDLHRMPPAGVTVVDTDALAQLRAWVAAMDTIPEPDSGTP